MKKLLFLILFAGTAFAQYGHNGDIAGIKGHIKLFTGHVYYVDATNGNDNNNGEKPEKAMATIGAAISLLSFGDAIKIKAGTYTETGIDLNVANCELWFEIGSIIDPASGTALTVSANYCRVSGDHIISPTIGEIGLLISGSFCNISDGRILAGGTGMRITGQGAVIDNYACGNQTSIAFDIQGSQTRLHNCSTVGIGASYGYKINNNVDTGVLTNCTSVGHETSSYYVSAGSKNWTILNCSSGADDGRWVDVDNSNVWSNFEYADEVYHITTFAGGGGSFDNLFKITGSVQIEYIFGDVDVVLSADIDDIYLEAYDGTNAVEITDNGGGGTDVSNAGVGSLIIKTEKATAGITLYNSSQVRVGENTNFRRPRIPFFITQKSGADTYIRVVYSGVATSGKIHWHCKWEPVDEDGFVEAI